MNRLFANMSKFGKAFEVDWPIKTPEMTEFGIKLLEECKSVKKPLDDSLPNVIEKSEKFGATTIKFPIDTCRIKSQTTDRFPIIEKQINSAYPVIHERVLWLYLKFLEHKIQYGSNIEKSMYTNLSLCDFVQRLLAKRCAFFVGPRDYYRLIDPPDAEGAGGFESVGLSNEKPPLLLKNCTSYDEIKLSALLSVSSHTDFINNGTRINCGKVEEDKSLIEESGVVVGFIGSRLCKPGFMEFQDIIIAENQNIEENGYGSKIKNKDKLDESLLAAKINYRKMWNDFYEEDDFLFSKTKRDNKRFGDAWPKRGNNVFDNIIMKKRFAISFDTLLFESESRAAAANQKAYIHVVGIGLGVWQMADQQDEIFLEIFAQRIKALLPVLNHVCFIHFSWFKLDECKEMKNGSFFESSINMNGGIKAFISKRNPSEKLSTPEFENCLLIQSFAWDGNSLPGNEFWAGNLHTSSDPAAACSTLITEIQNPHINDRKVCGDNLHVASEKYGVVHIRDFASTILK